MKAEMAIQTPHILVVEDDPSVAKALAAGIGEEGYDVHCEGTAAGGMSYARDKSPHLIVLDVRLPDGSGFDVCRQLRQMGLRQPILMLTVQTDEVDKVLGLEMGADDYITKPYRLRELIARIRALLRRTYGELSSVDADMLFAGDLVIDRAAGQVTRAGRRINLTPTEFRLLAFLAQNPRQAFSRQQLLDHVWGYTGFSDEKMVTSHIRRLREKIETDPSDPTLVVTVPGIGYRLGV
jgi:DNA-binding response OmpR family regulator